MQMQMEQISQNLSEIISQEIIQIKSSSQESSSQKEQSQFSSQYKQQWQRQHQRSLMRIKKINLQCIKCKNTFFAEQLYKVGQYKDALIQFEKNKVKHQSFTQIETNLEVTFRRISFLIKIYCSLKVYNLMFKNLNQIKKTYEKNKENEKITLLYQDALFTITSQFRMNRLSLEDQIYQSYQYIKECIQAHKDYVKLLQELNQTSSIEYFSSILILVQTFQSQQKNKLAIFYGKKCLKLSKAIQEETNIQYEKSCYWSAMQVFSSLGIIYTSFKKFRQAIKYFNMVLAIHKNKQFKNKDLNIEIYKSLGISYFLLGNRKYMLKYLETYLEKTVKKKNYFTLQIAELYSFVAQMYAGLVVKQKPLQYYKKALQIYEKLQEKNTKIYAQNLFAYGVQLNKVTKKNIQSVEQIFREYIRIMQGFPQKDQNRYHAAFYYIGSLSLQRKDYLNAIQIMHPALKYFQKLKQQQLDQQQQQFAETVRKDYQFAFRKWQQQTVQMGMPLLQ